MLDEMAANNPETYKKFIDKQMRETTQDLADRNPSAEFCVKIWIHNENCFLFVEVFSWKLISAPKVLENQTQQLPAHITEVEYQTYLKGDKRSARLMLVINPEVVQEFYPANGQPSSDQHYLMQNILELIKKQTGLSLKTDSFEFLDKTTCRGDPVKLRHKIFNLSKQKSSSSEKKQESVLEHLSNIKLSEKSDDDDDENKKFVKPLLKLEDKSAGLFMTPERTQSKKPALIHEVSDTNNYPVEPSYEINTCEENCIIVYVQLPGVKSGAECEVDLMEDVLTIEVDNRYSLLLPLDAKIDEANTSADFSARSALLTVKIPLLMQH